MSDSYRALVVEFDSAIDEETAERLVEAIGCIRHVQRVVPQVAGWEYHQAVDTAKSELRAKLWEVLKG